MNAKFIIRHLGKEYFVTLNLMIFNEGVLGRFMCQNLHTNLFSKEIIVMRLYSLAKERFEISLLRVRLHCVSDNACSEKGV